jgi:FimV-like protein
MQLRFLLKNFILLGSLTIAQFSMAVSLGNLVISSPKNENLEASIGILMSDQEAKSLGQLSANLGDKSIFDKFGIKKPADEFNPTVTIEKDGTGKPHIIRMKFSQKSEALEKAFNDLVIELSWSSGKITRVYTLLNTQAKEIAIQPGDSLVKITSQIAPTLSGADFEQVLVALYRLNPQAFYSGNIHRLKAGESLQVPSSSMAASIPQQEAINFTTKGYQDFKEKQFNQSSEKVLIQSNKTFAQAKLRDEFKDRLKIGSSEQDTEQSVNQAKLNEDMIAQQKMLEEAQQRIAELERNIQDLKELNEKKIALASESLAATSSANQAFTQYGWLLGILVLAGVFLFGIYKKEPLQEMESKSLPSNPLVMEEPVLKSPINTLTVSKSVTPLVEPKHIADEDAETPVTISSAAIAAAQSEIPPQAKKIFESIDLNLPSSTSSTPTVVTPPGAFALDLGVAGNPQSTSVSVTQSKLHVDEQRVRLNLAKSYIKIKDADTARILLTDLINLGADADLSVLDDAKKLMLDLG